MGNRNFYLNLWRRKNNGVFGEVGGMVSKWEE